MNSFHNTTNLAGAQLELAEVKAASQEDVVLSFCMKHRNMLVTPEIVHASVLQNAPLTSVRRAMSNLTRAGKLKKTEAMVKGQYGARVHCWVLEGKA